MWWKFAIVTVLWRIYNIWRICWCSKYKLIKRGKKHFWGSEVWVVCPVALSAKNLHNLHNCCSFISVRGALECANMRGSCCRKNTAFAFEQHSDLGRSPRLILIWMSQLSAVVLVVTFVDATSARSFLSSRTIVMVSLIQQLCIQQCWVRFETIMSSHAWLWTFASPSRSPG